MPFEQRKQSSSSAKTAVVAVECVVGTFKTALRSGDILEEIRIEGSSTNRPVVVSAAPFKNGRRGVQKLLRHSSKRGDTSIVIKVRRGTNEFLELQACVVPDKSPAWGRTVYVIQSVDDPNLTASFVDRTEEECFTIQGRRRRSSRVAFSELSKAQVEDGYMPYSWEKKMKDSLQVSGSSSLLSFLVLPRSTDPTNPKYNGLEDTLARANAWLNSSQASGVPIVFMNVQAEAMLTKISGEMASCSVNSGSFSDLVNLANSSLYGFEDYHGVDIGVMRAVRLWYTPAAGEYGIEIKIKEGDAKLGFAVSRTDEGFIYISSVSTSEEETEDLPSTRSGLRDLYQEAIKASRLLVISRVSNEKILPWMVSTSGAIRCFDTVSLSQKLSLHRHAVRPIHIHVLMWDRKVSPPSGQRQSGRVVAVSPRPDVSDSGLVGDAAGESSFRFTDYNEVVPNNWV